MTGETLEKFYMRRLPELSSVVSKAVGGVRSRVVPHFS